jgi:hypothetical protein
MLSPKYPNEAQSDLDTRFKCPAPPEKRTEREDFLHDHFRQLAGSVCQQVPPGRERALVLTKLEEALMWALTGIAREPKESDGD